MTAAAGGDFATGFRECMIGSMESLLIRGLRQGHVQGGEDWRTLTTNAIRGKWPAPAASRRTRTAERGLGIDGKPYYFYVLRAEEDYGLVVFVLREVENAVWPADARGATPFDSGGLWWNKIATEPKLDDAGRRAFFACRDVPLVDWRSTFEKYVQTRYVTVSSYLEGNAPEPGSESPDPEITVVKGYPNDKRAWTWEVRVPHDLVADRLALLKACMTEKNLDYYLDWLSHSPLTDGESRRIRQWIDEHVIVPDRGMFAPQTVEDWLAEVADA